MWISFILNIAIVLMVAFSFFAMFIGWDFMGKEGQLDNPGVAVFKYFTIDSNLLMGVCSLVMTICQIQVLRGRMIELPAMIYAIKLMGTSAVMLTFLVTVFFLVPQFEKPMALFYNGNLFFHLIVPIVAAVSFIVTERTGSLTFGHTLLGAVPTVCYAIFYVIHIFTHLIDGQVDKKYDFYNFLNGKKERMPIVATAVIVISYIFTLLLWFCNKVG